MIRQNKYYKMTNKEIEKIFKDRFVINNTTYDKNTFVPQFNFFDKRYRKAYSVMFNATDYDRFRIEFLSDIVKNDIETIRDEKIDEILNEKQIEKLNIE